MVRLNFANPSLNKSNFVSPALTGYTNGKSFQFGIWEGKTLVEMFALALDDLNKLPQKIIGFEPKEINLVHSSNLYEHVSFNSFEPYKLEQYFAHANKEKLADSEISYEKLKQQKVYTLSGLEKKLGKILLELNPKTKTHHVSTALANTCLDQKDQMLILISDSMLQLIVHKENKFYFFNQADTASANDYLYYILLAAKQLQIDVSEIDIVIGGSIDKLSPLYTNLKSYLHNLRFFTSSKYTVEGSDLPFHYYMPLIIARICA